MRHRRPSRRTHQHNEASGLYDGQLRGGGADTTTVGQDIAVAMGNATIDYDESGPDPRLVIKRG